MFYQIVLPIKLKPISLHEGNICFVIDENVNNKDFEKSDTEIETFDDINELKFPHEYGSRGIIILDGLNDKGMTIFVFKRGLRDQDQIVYLYSISVKIITIFQNELSELMETSIIYSNQIFSEKYKVFIRT